MNIEELLDYINGKINELNQRKHSLIMQLRNLDYQRERTIAMINECEGMLKAYYDLKLKLESDEKEKMDTK